MQPDAVGLSHPWLTCPPGLPDPSCKATFHSVALSDVHSVISPSVQNFAFVFPQFNEVAVSPLVQHVDVPLMTTLPFGASTTLKLSIICKPAEVLFTVKGWAFHSMKCNILLIFLFKLLAMISEKKISTYKSIA